MKSEIVKAAPKFVTYFGRVATNDELAVVFYDFDQMLVDDHGAPERSELARDAVLNDRSAEQRPTAHLDAIFSSILVTGSEEH